MAERLIDYLFGSIDEAERAALESLFSADADLTRELQILYCAVAWLDDASEPARPPPQLAEQTHRRIFSAPDRCMPRNREPPQDSTVE